VQVVAAWRRGESLQSAEQATNQVVRATFAPGRGRDAGTLGARRRG